MSKLLVSIREGAEMLSVSVRTVHRYCSLGLLHEVRVGRRKLLKMSELLAFAENGVSAREVNAARGK